MAERRDQAAGLRTLFAPRTTRVAAFAPSLPGAGQSAAAAALADALAGRGERVLLVQAHGRAARPSGPPWPTSSEVARAACALGAAGDVPGLAAGGDHDWVLIDAGGAAWDACPELAAHCDLVVLTAGREPRAITGAYARLKQLTLAAGRRRFELVGLRMDVPAAAALHRRLAATALRFLGVGLGFGGSLGDDEAVARAQRLRRPLFDAFPRSAYARAVAAYADRIAHAPGIPSRSAEHASARA